MRLLVAEDEKRLNKIICEALEDEGYSVDACFDGEQALEYARAAEYDAMVMDIMMPRMNGLDATRAIRAMKRRDARVIPIIAMSANAFADDIINGRLAGMNRHLAKPVDEESMIRALRECMSENDVLKLSDEL